MNTYAINIEPFYREADKVAYRWKITANANFNPYSPESYSGYTVHDKDLSEGVAHSREYAIKCAEEACKEHARREEYRRERGKMLLLEEETIRFEF